MRCRFGSHLYGRKAFIFDVDGTLALRGDRSPYDMRKISGDAVNEPVAVCMSVLRDAGFSILLFSGRDEAYREATEIWLARNCLIADILLMRPAGSKEKDDLIKMRMLWFVRETYEIIGAFDDRKRVKRMWVENGVFVFDVNQFDEEF